MPGDKLPGGRANSGRARMAKLSPEQRRELAVMGAKKRWEGKPKKVKPEKRAKRAMSTYTEQEQVKFPKELPLDEQVCLVLRRLLDELPQKRDWLDPELEQTAKYLLTLKKAEREKQAAQANTLPELKDALSEMIDYVLSIPFVSGPDGAKLVSDVYVTALRSMAMQARAALAVNKPASEKQV